MKIKILLCMLILFRSYTLQAQGKQENYTCLFYNLENLFIPLDDSTSMDDEFTAEGVRNWNWYRYHQKISSICKVLISVNQWSYPDIVCISEIENHEAAENIIHHPLLIHSDYGILHRDSPDHRGLDVAMLYNQNRFICIDTSWIGIKDKHGIIQQTREMLAATFASSIDTLMCIGVHWTSKYGGAYETEKKRKRQAEILADFIDSVLHVNPNIQLVVGGDFNDPSNSASIHLLTTSCNIREIKPMNDASTYKYKGKWESIDHVFVGNNKSRKTFSSKVHDPDYLLEKDKKYSGKKPFRTYVGYQYNAGVSDHLPLILKIGWEE